MPSNFYDVLGVARTATPEDIRSSYRALAKQLHPDKGGDPAQFRSVTEAYELLSNPEQRRLYDRRLESRNQSGGTNPVAAAADDEQVAAMFARLAEMKERAAEDQRKGLRWGLGAAGISLVTYEVAHSGGGRFFILWGPAIYGFLRAWRAFQHRQAIVAAEEDLKRRIEGGEL